MTDKQPGERVILFIIVAIALVAGAIYFSNNEDKKISEHVDQINKRLIALEKERPLEIDQLKRLTEIIIAHGNKAEKLSEKLEWLEMKVSAKPSPAHHEKLILTQEKPLQLQIVYRKAKQEASYPATSEIKKIKKQLEGLSK
jgi:hypothetical protein